MRLEELLSGDATTSQPSHEVTHVVPLDARSPSSDSLRYYDGNGTAHFVPGGVLIVPHGYLISDHLCVRVECDDPKAVFFEAVRRLYPDGVQCRSKMGLRFKAHHTTVIGKDGFGYYNGKCVPHIGHVTISDDVEIGAHTCIDRGTLGDTYIGSGTKIDNLVHIAHNVRIGKNCQIVAGAVIGGSAVLGDNVFVGINASIKNKVRIGDGAIIGMGAVVLKDVPAGATVVGNPAQVLTKLGTAKAPL